MDTLSELPLSFGQQRLWLLSRLAPSSSSYLLSGRFRIAGSLDLAALAAAIREAVRRHEILRTVFVSRHGRPAMVLGDEQPDRVLRVVDLTELPEADRVPAWERLSREETVRPFDLATGPLFRFTVARLGERDHALILTMHHIVSDNVSFAILLTDMAAAYRALLDGTPGPLSPPDVQYADFAQWQHEWMAGVECDEQVAYWRAQLATCPAEMPLGGGERPAGDGPAPPAVAAPLDLPDELTARMLDFARTERTTMFVTLLAGYGLAVGLRFGLPEVVVACPVSTRNMPEVQDLVGFFVNTLPIRVALPGGVSFRELVRQVRGTVSMAMDHQDVPFDRIVSALRPSRRPGRPPFFQVVLNYVADQPTAFALPGVEVTALPAHPVAARAEFALDVQASDGGAALRGELLHDPVLQPRDAGAELLATMRTALAAGLRSPDRPVAS